MSTATVPRVTGYPVPATGADLNSEPVRTQITNIVDFLEGANLATGNVDVTEVATLATANTWTANQTLTATLTVGVDDTGYDVQFFGATTGKSMLWDESADKLVVTGDMSVSGTISGTMAFTNATVSGTLGVTGVGTFTAQSVHTGGIESGGNIVSDTDSTDDLGTTGVRWANLWVDDVTATTGVNAGTMTIGAGSITDSSGAISFGNENLSTTGTLGAGATTVTSLDATQIGINNSSPTWLMEASKSADNAGVEISSWSLTDTHTPVLIMQKSASATINTLSQTADNEQLGRIEAYGVNSSSAIASGASIDFQQDGAAGATYLPERIVFNTGDNAGAKVERVRISSDGSMDIGTGQLSINAGVTNDVIIGQNVANTLYSSISLNADLSASGKVGLTGGNNDNNLYIDTATGGSHIFRVGESSTSVTFDSSGNVNIPGLTASSDVQTDGSKNLVSVSDQRLKTDDGLILDNALGIINQLIPRYFRYKSDEANGINARQLGFYAQEVNPLIPEAAPVFDVYEKDEDGNNIGKPIGQEWGFNSRGITAFLVKAVQELSAKVSALEA